MKIIVYGAGAIGGVTGAFAAQAGEDVTFVDIVPEHVRSINQRGLGVSGLRGDFTVHASALEPHQLQGLLDLVLLAVKSHHTAAAMDVILPQLGPDSTVVSLQNGINEEPISALIGPHRTIGCLINWGADYQAPGHIEFGGDGPFHLGNLDGRDTPRLQDVCRVLSHAAPTEVTSNIWGHLWSKQIWGGFWIGNALGTSNCAQMLDNRSYRPILLGLFREGVEVALASGVTLEPFSAIPFDPPALVRWPLVRWPLEDTHSLFDAMAEYFRPHLKAYSGPWRDIAVRNRPTEVDHIIGPIVNKGRELGIPTPLSSRLVQPRP